VRARPAALSLALVLDHRLNDRRHRRVRYAANRQNNRICASTTLDGSQLIAALNRGYRTSSATQCKLRRVTGQWWLIAAEYLRPVFDWTRRYTGAQIVRFVERDLRADALATARQAGSAFASWPIATYSRTGCPRPARHFREAIELCTRTGYDVVLLDCLHSYA